MRRVQAGDRAAYAELYQRHEPAVRRVCARWLHDDAVVDDLVQAAFVRALEHIDRCTGESRFAGWVQVIAQRMCIDATRAASRVQARIGHQPAPDGGGVGRSEDPADTFLRHEQLDALQLAITDLPPRQREVVVARLVEGRGPAEIAATLGMTIAAVDSLLLRARRKLVSAYDAVADERGGASLPAASVVAMTALVGTQPALVARAAAAVARVAALPAAPVMAAGSATARVARGVAVAVAAAVGGGMVAPPVAPHLAIPPPAATAAAAVAPSPTGGPTVDPLDPLDPSHFTIVPIDPTVTAPTALPPVPAGAPIDPAGAGVLPVPTVPMPARPPAGPAVPAPAFGGLPAGPGMAAALVAAAGILAEPASAAPPYVMRTVTGAGPHASSPV